MSDETFLPPPPPPPVGGRDRVPLQRASRLFTSPANRYGAINMFAAPQTQHQQNLPPQQSIEQLPQAKKIPPTSSFSSSSSSSSSCEETLISAAAAATAKETTPSTNTNQLYKNASIPITHTTELSHSTNPLNSSINRAKQLQEPLVHDTTHELEIPTLAFSRIHQSHEVRKEPPPTHATQEIKQQQQHQKQQQHQQEQEEEQEEEKERQVVEPHMITASRRQLSGHESASPCPRTPLYSGSDKYVAPLPQHHVQHNTPELHLVKEAHQSHSAFASTPRVNINLQNISGKQTVANTNNNSNNNDNSNNNNNTNKFATSPFMLHTYRDAPRVVANTELPSAPASAKSAATLLRRDVPSFLRSHELKESVLNRTNMSSNNVYNGQAGNASHSTLSSSRSELQSSLPQHESTPTNANSANRNTSNSEEARGLSGRRSFGLSLYTRNRVTPRREGLLEAALRRREENRAASNNTRSNDTTNNKTKETSTRHEIYNITSQNTLHPRVDNFLRKRTTDSPSIRTPVSPLVHNINTNTNYTASLEENEIQNTASNYHNPITTLHSDILSRKEREEEEEEEQEEEEVEKKTNNNNYGDNKMTQHANKYDEKTNKIKLIESHVPVRQPTTGEHEEYENGIIVEGEQHILSNNPFLSDNDEENNNVNNIFTQVTTRKDAKSPILHKRKAYKQEPKEEKEEQFANKQQIDKEEMKQMTVEHNESDTISYLMSKKNNNMNTAVNKNTTVVDNSVITANHSNNLNNINDNSSNNKIANDEQSMSMLEAKPADTWNKINENSEWILNEHQLVHDKDDFSIDSHVHPAIMANANKECVIVNNINKELPLSEVSTSLHSEKPMKTNTIVVPSTLMTANSPHLEAAIINNKQANLTEETVSASKLELIESLPSEETAWKSSNTFLHNDVDINEGSNNDDDSNSSDSNIDWTKKVNTAISLLSKRIDDVSHDQEEQPEQQRTSKPSPENIFRLSHSRMRNPISCETRCDDSSINEPSQVNKIEQVTVHDAFVEEVPNPFLEETSVKVNNAKIETINSQTPLQETEMSDKISNEHNLLVNANTAKSKTALTPDNYVYTPCFAIFIPTRGGMVVCYNNTNNNNDNDSVNHNDIVTNNNSVNDNKLHSNTFSTNKTHHDKFTNIHNTVANANDSITSLHTASAFTSALPESSNTMITTTKHNPYNSYLLTCSSLHNALTAGQSVIDNDKMSSKERGQSYVALLRNIAHSPFYASVNTPPLLHSSLTWAFHLLRNDHSYNNTISNYHDNVGGISTATTSVATNMSEQFIPHSLRQVLLCLIEYAQQNESGDRQFVWSRGGQKRLIDCLLHNNNNSSSNNNNNSNDNNDLCCHSKWMSELKYTHSWHTINELLSLHSTICQLNQNAEQHNHNHKIERAELGKSSDDKPGKLSNIDENEKAEKKKEDALKEIETLISVGKREDAVDLALQHHLYEHAILISMVCTHKDYYLKIVDAIVKEQLPLHSPLAHAYCLFNNRTIPPFVPSHDSKVNTIGGKSDEMAQTAAMHEELYELQHNWHTHASVLISNFSVTSIPALLQLADALQQANLVMAAHTCLLLILLSPVMTRKVSLLSSNKKSASGEPSIINNNNNNDKKEETKESISALTRDEVVQQLVRRLGVLGGFYHPTQSCRANFLTPLSTILTDILQEVRVHLCTAFSSSSRKTNLENKDMANNTTTTTTTTNDDKSDNSSNTVTKSSTHGIPERSARFAINFHFMQILWLYEVGMHAEASTALHSLLNILPAPSIVNAEQPVPNTLNALIYALSEKYMPHKTGSALALTRINENNNRHNRIISVNKSTVENAKSENVGNNYNSLEEKRELITDDEINDANASSPLNVSSTLPPEHAFNIPLQANKMPRAANKQLLSNTNNRSNSNNNNNNSDNNAEDVTKNDREVINNVTNLHTATLQQRENEWNHKKEQAMSRPGMTNNHESRRLFNIPLPPAPPPPSSASPLHFQQQQQQQQELPPSHKFTSLLPQPELPHLPQNVSPTLMPKDNMFTHDNNRKPYPQQSEPLVRKEEEEEEQKEEQRKNISGEEEEELQQQQDLFTAQSGNREKELMHKQKQVASRGRRGEKDNSTFDSNRSGNDSVNNSTSNMDTNKSYNNNNNGKSEVNKGMKGESATTKAQPRRSRSIDAIMRLFGRGKSEKPEEQAKPMILNSDKPPEFDEATGRWMFPETEEEKAERELIKQGPPRRSALMSANKNKLEDATRLHGNVEQQHVPLGQPIPSREPTSDISPLPPTRTVLPPPPLSSSSATTTTTTTAAAAASGTSTSAPPAQRMFGAAPPVPVGRGQVLPGRRGRSTALGRPQYVDLFN